MYYFIVNPSSGCGRGRKVWKLVKKELERQRVPFRSCLLRSPGEAGIVAGALSKLSAPCTAVILGGDGTINEFLNGLTCWEHLTLGCIPTGSGNDFVRGLSLEREPKKALEAILHPRSVAKLKLGAVRAGDRSHIFAVSSGIGFDADVCNGVGSSRLKNLLNWFHAGKLVYLATALRLLVTMKVCPLTLTLDNGEERSFDRVFFAASMNMRYEGGGFQFAPMASPQAENFQLCLADSLTRGRVLSILPLAFSGGHVGKRGIHILPFQKARLQAAAPLCVHTDGEIFGFFDSITIEALPQRLSVILTK